MVAAKQHMRDASSGHSTHPGRTAAQLGSPLDPPVRRINQGKREKPGLPRTPTAL